METINNVKNLYHQNIEKNAWIKELQEQLRGLKIDEGSLQNFKASVEKVRVELEETIIDMYGHLYMFQGT
jgi:hypothetical protein